MTNAIEMENKVTEIQNEIDKLNNSSLIEFILPKNFLPESFKIIASSYDKEKGSVFLFTLNNNKVFNFDIINNKSKYEVFYSFSPFSMAFKRLHNMNKICLHHKNNNNMDKLLNDKAMSAKDIEAEHKLISESMDFIEKNKENIFNNFINIKEKIKTQVEDNNKKIDLLRTEKRHLNQNMIKLKKTYVREHCDKFFKFNDDNLLDFLMNHYKVESEEELVKKVKKKINFSFETLSPLHESDFLLSENKEFFLDDLYLSNETITFNISKNKIKFKSNIRGVLSYKDANFIYKSSFKFKQGDDFLDGSLFFANSGLKENRKSFGYNDKSIIHSTELYSIFKKELNNEH